MVRGWDAGGMSDLAEFERFITGMAEEEFGHRLGGWRWSPDSDGTPAHRAICKACGGSVELLWDRNVRHWIADGDLIACNCGTAIDKIVA